LKNEEISKIMEEGICEQGLREDFVYVGEKAHRRVNARGEAKVGGKSPRKERTLRNHETGSGKSHIKVTGLKYEEKGAVGKH